MKKVLTVLSLAFILVLTGCNQEKAQITEYLKTVEASNQKMKTMAKDMETQMKGLEQEIAGGTFDAEATKQKITDFSDKMKAEKESLEGIEVPEKAKALHDATMSQYQLALDVLDQTLPMIDLAKKVTDAAAMVKADPTKAKAVMAEIQAASTEIQALSTKIQELTEKGKGFEETAKAEQKKLQDEFGIEFKEETADAGGSEEEAK